MIYLDNGPKNSGRRTQFLKRMVEFADWSGLEIRLVYYPPYHSKYNPIERCWSSLEKKWNGVLLNCWEVVLQCALRMRWKGRHPTVKRLEGEYARRRPRPGQGDEADRGATGTVGDPAEVRHHDQAENAGIAGKVNSAVRLIDYLWTASKPELIKDEPLAVKVPMGLQPLTPKIYVPASNPITKGKYELGRQLYFDPRVSLDSTVSCATCHNPARGGPTA